MCAVSALYYGFQVSSQLILYVSANYKKFLSSINKMARKLLIMIIENQIKSPGGFYDTLNISQFRKE
jgi:hypothetical protein